jgi:hypothetical protein
VRDLRSFTDEAVVDCCQHARRLPLEAEFVRSRKVREAVQSQWLVLAPVGVPNARCCQPQIGRTDLPQASGQRPRFLLAIVVRRVDRLWPGGFHRVARRHPVVEISGMLRVDFDLADHHQPPFIVEDAKVDPQSRIARLEEDAVHWVLEPLDQVDVTGELGDVLAVNGGLTPVEASFQSSGASSRRAAGRRAVRLTSSSGRGRRRRT